MNHSRGIKTIACSSRGPQRLGYQPCGSTWYQPQFVGTTTSYVVVTAPR